MDNSEDDPQRITDQIYHSAELAEAHAERLNRLVRRIGEAGALPAGTILGPVIQENEYDPRQDSSDSAQVVQAVLHFPKGLGVVFWDTEEFAAIKEEGEVQIEAMRQFVPFGECELAVRAAFLPHLQAFIAQLRKRLR